MPYTIPFNINLNMSISLVVWMLILIICLFWHWHIFSSRGDTQRLEFHIFPTKRNVSTYLCTHIWGRRRRPALGRKQIGLIFHRWTSCHKLGLSQPWSVYLHRPQPCKINQVVMEQSGRFRWISGITITAGKGALIICWPYIWSYWGWNLYGYS